jgi:hypothetical protein
VNTASTGLHTNCGDFLLRFLNLADESPLDRTTNHSAEMGMGQEGDGQELTSTGQEGDGQELTSTGQVDNAIQGEHYSGLRGDTVPRHESARY